MTISELSASIEQSVMYNQLGVVSGMQRLQASIVLCRAYRAMSDWRCLGPSQPLCSVSFLIACQSGRQAAATARRAASTLDSMLAVIFVL